MRTNLKILVVVVTLFFATNVKAACSNSEKTKLSKLASNLTFSYTYQETDDSLSFYAIITNTSTDFLMVNANTNERIQATTDEVIFSGLAPNQSYKFLVYSNTCGSIIYTKYLTTPAYNKFYKSEACINNNNKLCNKWINISYDYETFAKNVSPEIIQEDVVEDNIEQVKYFYDYLIEYFVKYYYIILPLIILISLITIYRLDKKSDLV